MEKTNVMRLLDAASISYKIHCYDKNVILDEGQLVSPFDIPMSDDEESFCEYCNNH